MKQQKNNIVYVDFKKQKIIKSSKTEENQKPKNVIILFSNGEKVKLVKPRITKANGNYYIKADFGVEMLH